MDFISRRYGVLPSKLISEGDIIDLQIALIGSDYEKWVRENPQAARSNANNHGLSKEQMQAAIEAVRAKNNG